MKRLAIFRGGVAMALMFGVLAVAASAEASRSGQLGVYMRQGLSLERAQVALATQSQVETAELPVRLEKALGASFAGMWFEPSRGKFCIGVVSGASRRAAEQVVAQAGLAGVVSYVSVRSTWTELINAKGEWNLKLAHLGGRQFSTGLTASNNAVSVTLSSSVPEHERALLEREAAGFHVNVSITVAPPESLVGRPRNSKCEFKRAEAYCSKPITAGVLITTLNTATPAATDYCTAGPLAILSNPATLAAELETLLITAGHCTEGTGKWYTSTHPVLGRVTQEIGSTVKTLWDLLGDYGDIEVGPNWLETGLTPAFAQITHYQDNGLREAQSVIGKELSMPNATFCHQGATSAEQCGAITATDVLFFYNSHDVDHLVRTNSCGELGDSGGPIATLPEGNSVRILGTETAGPVETCSELFCPSHCLSYYEPIKTSLEGLGLTLLTTANQTRHKLPNEWLIDGELIAPPVRVHSLGLLLLEDTKATGGAVSVHCRDFDTGTVGPHGLDLIEKITLELLGTKNEVLCLFDKNGACEAGTMPTAEAVHLPWLTELVLINGQARDLILADPAGPGGKPGWKVACKTIIGSTTDECLEEEGRPGSTLMENTESGVLGKFDAFTPRVKCSIGGKESGKVEGTVLTESPSPTLHLSISL